MSEAMALRLPKTLPICCMLSSISSSRAQLVIFGSNHKPREQIFNPLRGHFYLIKNGLYSKIVIWLPSTPLTVDVVYECHLLYVRTSRTIRYGLIPRLRTKNFLFVRRFWRFPSSIYVFYFTRSINSKIYFCKWTK